MNNVRQEIQWHMGVDVGASTRTSTGTSYYRDRYEGEPIMSPQYYERIKQKPPPVKKLDWKDSLRKEIKEYLTLN